MLSFLIAATFDLQTCYNVSAVNRIVRIGSGMRVEQADRIWFQESSRCKSGIMPKRLIPLIKIERNAGRVP